MNELLVTLWLLVMWITAFPVWIYVSSAITIVHTIEEAEGSIWEVLHVPEVLYFTFQAIVFGLGVAAGFDSLVLIFAGVRIVDVIVTHMILRAPGIYTSPLLALDAAVVLCSWSVSGSI